MPHAHAVNREVFMHADTCTRAPGCLRLGGCGYDCWLRERQSVYRFEAVSVDAAAVRLSSFRGGGMFCSDQVLPTARPHRVSSSCAPRCHGCVRARMFVAGRMEWWIRQLCAWRVVVRPTCGCLAKDACRAIQPALSTCVRCGGVVCGVAQVTVLEKWRRASK